MLFDRKVSVVGNGNGFARYTIRLKRGKAFLAVTEMGPIPHAACFSEILDGILNNPYLSLVVVAVMKARKVNGEGLSDVHALGSVRGGRIHAVVHCDNAISR